MKPLALATANRGKINELTPLLKSLGFELQPANAFEGGMPEETGKTFIENALIKARDVSARSNMAALADDSGLVVPALAGAPGIHSSRYAGEEASSEENIQKLLEAMSGIEAREAYFYCVLVLISHPDDPMPLVAEGKWDGQILTSPQGEKGFGYDPIFYIPEHRCSAAMLAPEVKRSDSHRGKALKILQERLQS